MLPSSKLTFFDVENPWCRSISKTPRRDASSKGSLWPLWGSHLRTGWDYDLPKWWKITYMYVHIYIYLIYIYIFYIYSICACMCVCYILHIYMINYIYYSIHTYVNVRVCIYIYTFPCKKWIRNDNNDRKPWCLATIVGVLCTKIGLVLNFGVTTL